MTGDVIITENGTRDPFFFVYTLDSNYKPVICLNISIDTTKMSEAVSTSDCSLTLCSFSTDSHPQLLGRAHDLGDMGLQAASGDAYLWFPGGSRNRHHRLVTVFCSGNDLPSGLLGAERSVHRNRNRTSSAHIRLRTYSLVLLLQVSEVSPRD